MTTKTLRRASTMTDEDAFVAACDALVDPSLAASANRWLVAFSQQPSAPALCEALLARAGASARPSRVRVAAGVVRAARAPGAAAALLRPCARAAPRGVRAPLGTARPSSRAAAAPRTRWCRPRLGAPTRARAGSARTLARSASSGRGASVGAAARARARCSGRGAAPAVVVAATPRAPTTRPTRRCAASAWCRAASRSSCAGGGPRARSAALAGLGGADGDGGRAAPVVGGSMRRAAAGALGACATGSLEQDEDARRARVRRRGRRRAAAVRAGRRRARARARASRAAALAGGREQRGSTQLARGAARRGGRARDRVARVARRAARRRAAGGDGEGAARSAAAAARRASARRGRAGRPTCARVRGTPASERGRGRRRRLRVARDRASARARAAVARFFFGGRLLAARRPRLRRGAAEGVGDVAQYRARCAGPLLSTLGAGLGAARWLGARGDARPRRPRTSGREAALFAGACTSARCAAARRADARGGGGGRLVAVVAHPRWPRARAAAATRSPRRSRSARRVSRRDRGVRLVARRLSPPRGPTAARRPGTGRPSLGLDPRPRRRAAACEGRAVAAARGGLQRRKGEAPVERRTATWWGASPTSATAVEITRQSRQSVIHSPRLPRGRGRRRPIGRRPRRLA